MAERGLHIVHEGADATGKSEQAIRTSKRLEKLGRRVLLVLNDDTDMMEPIQEPGGVPIANELRRIIKNARLIRTPWQNVQLFTVARSANWEQAMQPALDNGIDVVTARSHISTVVYQGAEGIPEARILKRTRDDVGDRYMNPDLELILAIDDENARQAIIANRGKLTNPDTFESKPEDFQIAMKDGYVRYALKHSIEIIPVHARPNMSAEEREMSINAVSDEIWKRVEPLLGS